MSHKESLHLLHEQAWMDTDKAVHYIPIKIVEKKEEISKKIEKKPNKSPIDSRGESTILGTIEERLEKLKKDHGIIVV